MAEIVAEMQERMLPEYEQLKKFEVCTEEEIRDCIRKRERFLINITKSEKTVVTYAEFILFEKKVHKWVAQKERMHGTKLAGLKTSIATRIIKLYREALQKFPHENNLWENFINFSKKSTPHEVVGIYEKMLTFHDDKPKYWYLAGLWAYQYSPNTKKFKEIFLRAVQRHPASETINKAFFDILLTEALKMNTDRNLENNKTSEQDIGMSFAMLVYRNSKKNIKNVDFFLSLVKRCEEEDCVYLTAPLQIEILDDLMEMFPREETLWHALAQRELRGINITDMRSFVLNSNNEANTIEDKPIQLRSLERQIELCQSIYKSAVTTLHTPKMWNLYINAMLDLNRNISEQPVLKRKCLADAFKTGHESGMMNIDHYCTLVRMLLETSQDAANNAELLVSDILSKAVQTHKNSPELYELWISMYISNDNEPKVYEILLKARQQLKKQSLKLWRLALIFYKTRNDCAEKLKLLYKEACQLLIPEFGVLRGDYLEFCYLNDSIEKARAEYDELCKLPPPCLDLHQKMAKIESTAIIKKKGDMERWRLCYVNAVNFFGSTNPSVWIDYIKFERDNANPKLVPTLYQRAISTLEPQLVDIFITEMTLLPMNS